MRGPDRCTSDSLNTLDHSLTLDFVQDSTLPSSSDAFGPQTLALESKGYELFMGFDYGVKRIGVCYGSKLLMSAKPCKGASGSAAEQWKQITERIQEFQPQALVVGVPFHPDGAEHVNTHKARRFIRQLGGRFNLPVFEVDERYSTTEVLSNHEYDIRKIDVDSESACIILNQFFRNINP